jgi:hypothetical protein
VEARDEEPVSDTAIPSMTRSSTARRVDIDAPGCRNDRRVRVSRVASGDALTEEPGVTPTATAQEVEVVMDSFQQPRPSTLEWPATATVTKVNTK